MLSLKRAIKEVKNLSSGTESHLVLFTYLSFADDIVLITTSEQNLQHNLIMWEGDMYMKNMTTDSTETKTMVIMRQTR